MLDSLRKERIEGIDYQKMLWSSMERDHWTQEEYDTLKADYPAVIDRILDRLTELHEASKRSCDRAEYDLHIARLLSEKDYAKKLVHRRT